jgi:trehalose 2-sulfotransferase
VTVTAETEAEGPGERRPDLSCLIATTPGAGSYLLCQALWETRLAGDPRDYFNPLKVVPRSVGWGLLGPGRDHLPRQPEDEFAGRYLNAVATAGTGPGGVFSAHLPWSHQRWLARFARAASPDVVGTSSRSDAVVLEQWYPQTRYVYMTSADVARQAGRWYLGRRSRPAATDGGTHPGQPLDFQEVRWMETLVSRQQRAWEVYFRVNGIEPYRIGYEDFLAHPEETVGGLLKWLGVPGTPAQVWHGEDHRERLARPAAWLSDYSAARDRLSAAIGVRQGQD